MTQHEVELFHRTSRLARWRELYFGELLSRYTARKRRARGLTFIAALGAALAAAGGWTPAAVVLASVAAAVSAWWSATDLDGRTLQLAATSVAWADLRLACDDSWWGRDRQLDSLQRHARDLEARTDRHIPHDQKTADRWRQHVTAEYGPF